MTAQLAGTVRLEGGSRSAGEGATEEKPGALRRSIRSDEASRESGKEKCFTRLVEGTAGRCFTAASPGLQSCGSGRHRV